MLAVTIIQLVVFITYIGYLINKFGILPSISESYYALMDSRKSYLFFLFTSALGVTMILQAQDQHVWYLISGIGLMFVGAASLFKVKEDGTAAIHYIGACVGIVGALIGHIEVYNLLWPVGVYLAGTLIILAVFRNGSYIWWMEILAFVTIIAGFISQLSL
jgi:hypothetical protein